MKKRINCFQRGIYHNEVINPNTSVNNIGGYIEFFGEVELDRMQQAVNLLIKSQSALRTEIVCQGDEVFYKVDNDCLFGLKEIFVDKKEVQNNIANIFFEPFQLLGNRFFGYLCGYRGIPAGAGSCRA